MVDQELLDILICPACGDGATVTPDPADVTLVCGRCGRRYPVREGIPVMLVDEATLPQAPVTGQARETAAPTTP
jgi:uncharacterized protein YbaR (Trm112 family)